MKPSELLARTQEILLERGLAKGETVLRDGKVCSGGALRLAAGAKVVIQRYGLGLSGYPIEEQPSVDKAWTYLTQTVGCLPQVWNDNNYRTLAEVVAGFHAAEILAKENGE